MRIQRARNAVCKYSFTVNVGKVELTETWDMFREQVGELAWRELE